MLKFFRKIRRKLIDEGNLKRYLIYAIGEILLVMIGILLALQVNNWNQNQISTKIETELLQRLKQDLEADFLRFIELENHYRESKESHDKFEQLLNKAELSDGDLMSVRGFGGVSVEEINPRLNTYEEMLNLGKLYSISDEFLVLKISEYYRSLDREIAETKELKLEYRRYFTNDRSLDYWRLRETDNPEELRVLMKVLSQKEHRSYWYIRTIKSWGILVINGNMNRLERLKEQNLALKESISAYLSKQK